MAQSNAFSVTVQASGGSGVPAYISSMSTYQVRDMAGSYAPTNGTSTLQSIAPGIWGGNMNIINPWSGGPKSTNGTKMYVHGGGHSDSSNNGIYSFDFAGASAPTGWTVENAGQTNVTSNPAVGATGQPVSVHTYDGMVDMGALLYRVGGSVYPNGFMQGRAFHFDKSSKVWTRLPDPPNVGAGFLLGNAASNKLLWVEKWATTMSYAFYRIGTNNWSSSKGLSAEWPSDGSAAYNPVTNTGIAVSSNVAFSFSVDWSTETISQTSRSLTSLGRAPGIVWDPTAGCYWAFGAVGNTGTLYAVNPTTYAITSHALTGNVPISQDGDYQGTYGRWVFMESWRAIGSVCRTSGSVFVIKLP